MIHILGWILLTIAALIAACFIAAIAWFIWTIVRDSFGGPRL